MKIIISRKTNRKYFFDENKNEDLHTKEGLIKKEDILNSEKTENIVKSNKGGREFLVLEGNDFDKSEKIIRGPQILTNKDLGYIIARTRLNKNSKILEAGGGSGAASIFFANLVEKVKTYEIVKEHFEIIEKNLKRNEIENLELILGDLSENIENEKENEYDLIFLDMPNPNEILKTSLKSLKQGKYIVCYQPSISQVIDIKDYIENNKRNELYIEEITEVTIRNWKVTNKIARPNFRKDIDHTAFLVFIRKV